MANLQDAMVTKLRTHYAQPTGEFNDLMKLWRADNAIDGWSKPVGGYQTFILANSVVAGGFVERQNDYWVNVYV